MIETKKGWTGRSEARRMKNKHEEKSRTRTKTKSKRLNSQEDIIKFAFVKIRKLVALMIKFRLSYFVLPKKELGITVVRPKSFPSVT